MKKKLFLCSALALCIFGVNTTVKADGYIADSAPDSFVTNAVGRLYTNGALTQTENDAVLANNAIARSKTPNLVIDYHTSAATGYKKIFCINRVKTYNSNGGVTYTKSDEEVDYGLVYIIANYLNYVPNVPNGGDVGSIYARPYEQSWFTQMAIWRYLDTDNSFAGNVSFQYEDDDRIYDGTTQISSSEPYYYNYAYTAPQLWESAEKMVKEAKQATDPSTVTNLNFKYDGVNGLNKEEKTVKTGIISLQTSGISSYSLNISDAVAGTKVYAEDGTEITDLNNVTAKSFYLVIPIENVDNYTYDFSIVAKSTDYTYYKGYKYTSGDDQPLLLVTKETKPLDATINIKGSQLEDTASSVVKTIYFVGFLILIAGVGLVYFNAKQKKEQI